MGNKQLSKTIMSSNNIPVVPWADPTPNPSDLFKAAQKIGFPIIMKPVHGGGGKGMRIVYQNDEKYFTEQLESSKREAKNSFGDDLVMIEKYITKPRHIEFQVFGDSKGNVVQLFERDCTVQRRHQKVLEESPAPGMTEALRRKMGEVAVKVGKAVGYVGAGTVEFIVDVEGTNPGTELDENTKFYFMEMNTRLQVEHPVTEMVTGLDLVELQFNVAMGHALPEHLIERNNTEQGKKAGSFMESSRGLKIRGHALEARIYAEDPDNNFLPQTGKLYKLQFPPNYIEGGAISPENYTLHKQFDTESNKSETKQREGIKEKRKGQIRVDTGVRTGDVVSVFYDPMIAKLIVLGDDRDHAIELMDEALRQTEIVGIKNNIDFLRRLNKSAGFGKRDLDTGFIAKYEKELMEEKSGDRIGDYGLGALMMLIKEQGAVQGSKKGSNDPWNERKEYNWRLNLGAAKSFSFEDENNQEINIEIKQAGGTGDKEYDVVVRVKEAGGSGKQDKKTKEKNVEEKREMRVRVRGEEEEIEVQGERQEFKVNRDEEGRIWVFAKNGVRRMKEKEIKSGSTASAAGGLMAPMPGKVIRIMVKTR